MIIPEDPAPLKAEPSYGENVGRVWEVSTKIACWGGDTWYGEKAQKKALDKGWIFQTEADAGRAARLERIRLWKLSKGE